MSCVYLLLCKQQGVYVCFVTKNGDFMQKKISFSV